MVGPSYPRRYVAQLADRCQGMAATVVGEVLYDPISVASDCGRTCWRRRPVWWP